MVSITKIVLLSALSRFFSSVIYRKKQEKTALLPYVIAAKGIFFMLISMSKIITLERLSRSIR